MLTYATLADFKEAKAIVNTTVATPSMRNIVSYLRRATSLINETVTRRFFPWWETRDFLIPQQFVNLRLRQFPAADIWFDQDLIEIKTVQGGYRGADGVITEQLTFAEHTDFILLSPNLLPKYGARVIAPKYWSGDYNPSIARNYLVPTVFFTGLWGFHTTAWEMWSDTEFVLPAALDATTKTVVLPAYADHADEFGFPAIDQGMLLRIDDELLAVQSATVDTDADTVSLKLERGAQNSVKAAHDDAAPIRRWNVIPEIVEYAVQTAKQWREHAEQTGGRVGVNEMSIGVELDLPNDVKRGLTRYRRSTIGRTGSG